jgi:ubiquinol-cytochrome c reductase cytochrome c1 subunit
MKKIILSLLLALGLVGGAAANEGGIQWDKFPLEKVSDVASLQNGAKLFVNYCLNCHSASFMRYNRMRDLDLSEDQIKKNLLFATDRVGEVMKTSIDPKLAKDWFGTTPPDLSVIARSRSGANGTGADYLYTYLRSYYRDPSKPTGWDNRAFPNVAMPHVLWELQGIREALPQVEVKDPHNEGKTIHQWAGYGPLVGGTLKPVEFDSNVADLVAFMVWMSEPAQFTRVRVGVWVLLFMGLFIVIAWRLNAVYWKEVK